MTSKDEVLASIENGQLREELRQEWDRGRYTPMPVADPAQVLIIAPHHGTPVVYRENCYICRDPEFAQMGLPLCSLCPTCKTGHVPADDPVCEDCGFDLQSDWEVQQAEWSGKPDVVPGEGAP